MCIRDRGGLVRGLVGGLVAVNDDADASVAVALWQSGRAESLAVVPRSIVELVDAVVREWGPPAVMTCERYLLGELQDVIVGRWATALGRE